MQAQQAANASECHQDGEKKVKEEKDRGGLPGIFCTVCLTRPVQVYESIGFLHSKTIRTADPVFKENCKLQGSINQHFKFVGYYTPKLCQDFALCEVQTSLLAILFRRLCV